MSKEAPRQNHARIERHEIAERAYKLWCEANRPAGQDLEFWLRAEAELLTLRRGRPSTTGSAEQGEGQETPGAQKGSKRKSQVARPASGKAK